MALRQSRRFSLPSAVAVLSCLGGLATASLWGLTALPAEAVELRVAVEDQAPSLAVGSSTPATVRGSDGQPLGQIPAGRSVVVSVQGGGLRLADWSNQAFWIEPNDGGYIFIGDAWYRGRVLLMASGGGVTAVNWVDVEAYLYSVLGGEMPTSWPLEALKAQAVAARSYALYQRQKAAQQPFDVSDTVSSQVYKGLASEASSTHAAVEATRGQVLLYGNQVIEAVFHSSSGGFTENVEDIWQRAVPYLRSVPDYDQGAPVFQWTETFSLDAFAKRITGIGQLQAAIPERTTPHGRVVTMRFQGSQGSRQLSGNEVRQALNLRSTLFNISISGNTVTVSGRGYGHGIGLSQWGAHNLAAQGQNYQQILTHYYRGVTLSQMQLASTP